ncbi:hypothetical protein BIWAKO_07001 [Bosea sp. BIWAKO-01]|nr:hypothetical protein BIWAKO_07001 [Bosea sp. BIWAKO-01]
MRQRRCIPVQGHGVDHCSAQSRRACPAPGRSAMEPRKSRSWQRQFADPSLSYKLYRNRNQRHAPCQR